MNSTHNNDPSFTLFPSLLIFAVAHGCRQGPNAPPDFFLGLLSISNGFKVYGAISNTKTRFLVATTDGVVREEDVKMVHNTGLFSFWKNCCFATNHMLFFLLLLFYAGSRQNTHPIL